MLGFNGGYSWGRSSRELNFVTTTGAAIVPAGGVVTSGGTDLEGGLFGGQIGYNWQTSNWVLGFETDIQWANQRGSRTFLCNGLACLPGLTVLPAGVVGSGAVIDQKLEWFGTFRGRGGFLVTPTALLYATGGLAYGSVQTGVLLTGFYAAGAGSPRPFPAATRGLAGRSAAASSGSSRATGAASSNISTWIWEIRATPRS